MEKERGPVKFEIVKRIGVLNTYPTGWSKEFNIVKWNDKSEKYDVRDWAPGHERMSRGVTMFEDELQKLFELCSGIFDEDDGSNAAEDTSAQMPSVAPEPAAKQVAEEVPF